MPRASFRFIKVEIDENGEGFFQRHPNEELLSVDPLDDNNEHTFAIDGGFVDIDHRPKAQVVLYTHELED